MCACIPTKDVTMFAAVLATCFAVSFAQVVVETHLGSVQGQTVQLHYDGVSVNTWHAIPFGASTADDLRWTMPVDAAPYDGIFVADRLGPACIQNERNWLWATHPGWSRFSEDCLSLDVYAPTNMSPEEPYAVMVFFHGGAFQSGASIQYPGHFLAARDVVVVIPNYRLGIFGFLNTNDSVAPGNYGLHDQRLALLLVQTNIANFGGDPSRVTIFGQSAGGASAGHHLISPGSQGLFSQCIEHSGTEMNFWAINWPASKPETYGQAVAEDMGCPTDDSQAQIDCLKTIDEWALLNASNPLQCNPGYFCLGFAPVVDGPDGFIPDIPLELRRRGEFAKVPLMTGYLLDDGALYTLAYIPEAMEGGFTREQFEHHLREDLLGMWSPQWDEQTTEDTFEAMNFFYSPWPFVNDTDLNREAFNVMITDAGMGEPSDRQARFQSQEVPETYQWVFGYRSNDSYYGLGGALEGTEWMGTFHSAELPYTFGYPLIGLSEEVRQDSRIFVDIFPYNDDDIAYSEFMTDLWANFAKFANPTPEPITPPFDNEPVTWQPYNTQSFNTFFMDRENEIRNIGDYSQHGLAFWRDYMDYVTGMDFYSQQSKTNGEGFNTQRYMDAENYVLDRILAQYDQADL